MLSNKKTSNCKKASLFYFAIVISTILFIATSMSLLKSQSHHAFNIQNALAQLQSLPSQSQMVSKEITLKTLPLVSAPSSINNTNVTAEEFLPGINITQMSGSLFSNETSIIKGSNRYPNAERI